MISLDEIVSKVNDFENIVKDIKTVEDARNLRHIGINENEIQVQFKDDDCDLDYISSEMDGNAEIAYIRFDMYDFLDYPGYDYVSEISDFGVFDAEIDDEFAYIDSATLKTIEKDYKEAIEAFTKFSERE